MLDFRYYIHKIIPAILDILPAANPPTTPGYYHNSLFYRLPIGYQFYHLEPARVTNSS